MPLRVVVKAIQLCKVFIKQTGRDESERMNLYYYSVLCDGHSWVGYCGLSL